MELLVAAGLVATILLTLAVGYSFISRQIVTALKLKNLYLQMDYALEHIALHCMSAANIDPTMFFAPVASGTLDTKNALRIEGESDVFRITPNNLADNAWYEYYKDAAGNIMFRVDGTTTEVLIDKEFNPTITFQYTGGTEPNYMSVTISGTAAGQPVTKTRGIRFWFVDIVK